MYICCEAGYNLYLQPRNYGRGGGVGILIHMDLPTPSISSVTFSYSDCLSCTFNFPFDILRIIVIYRPPIGLIIPSFLMNSLIA